MGSNYKVEWIGKKEFEDVLNKALSRSEKQVHDVVYNTAEKAKKVAMDNAPKPGGSRYGENPYAEGFLSKHIVTNYPSRLQAEVISKAGYSGYVNFGTRFMKKRQPFMSDTFKEFVKPEMEKQLTDVAKGLFK